VGCHDFVIDDSFSDGMCCNGYFKGSIYGWKEVFNGGGRFGSQAIEHFCGEDVCPFATHYPSISSPPSSRPSISPQPCPLPSASPQPSIINDDFDDDFYYYYYYYYYDSELKHATTTAPTTASLNIETWTSTVLTFFESIVTFFKNLFLF